MNQKKIPPLYGELIIKKDFLIFFKKKEEIDKREDLFPFLF
jgi:hypothetical protein